MKRYYSSICILGWPLETQCSNKNICQPQFKNVPLAVAIHHQQWMFYQLATCPGQDTSNFLYAGDEIGSGLLCLLYCFTCIALFFFFLSLGRLCEIQDHKVAIAQLCGEHPSDENLIVLRCGCVIC